MPSYTFFQPKKHDFKSLKEMAEIDKKAFGCDGISVFNLLQFQYCSMLFALKNEKNKIIAEAVVLKKIKNNGAWLFSFAVAANERFKGAGFYLLNKITQRLRKMGLEHLELTMNPKNAAAKRLYIDKSGFYKKKTLKPHPQKNEPRWLVRLDLTQKKE